MRLLKSFIIRSSLRSPLRAGVTVIGVVLGVALVVAVQLANRSSLSSFRSATVAVAGESSLSIVSRSGSFTEDDYASLSELKRHGTMSPIVEGLVKIETNEAALETGQLLGIDLLTDSGFRQFQFYQLLGVKAELSALELLSILSNKESILVSKKLVDRLGKQIGDKLTVLVNDRKLQLTIVGILKESGPASQQVGNLLVADIGSAQWMLAFYGKLSRVDYRASDAATPLWQAREEIQHLLPTQLIIEEPVARVQELEKLIASFHFNLQALASIAMLVAVFLIYNFVSSSVLQRRSEIGVLRAIGVSPLHIAALFIFEGLAFAILGTIGGLILGPILAQLVSQSSLKTLETFYLSSAALSAIQRPQIEFTQALLVTLSTLALATISALFPALEAAKISPLEAMRPQVKSHDLSTLELRSLLVTFFFLMLAGLTAGLPAVQGKPVWGYVSSLCSILGIVSLSSLLLACLPSALRLFRLRESQSFLLLRLATASLASSRKRLAPSISALAVALAMMFSVTIMIDSFRETVSYWLNQTLQADIFIRPAARETPTFDARISPETLQLVSKVKGIQALAYFSPRELLYQGTSILLAVGDLQVTKEHGGLVFKEPSSAEQALTEAVTKHSAVVSESFALRFGKSVRDKVCLPFRVGERCLIISGIYYDYSSNQGTVVLDKHSFDVLAEQQEAAPEPANLAIFIESGVLAETVRAEILRQLPSDASLVIESRDGLKEEALRIFDSTFAITYILQIIAIIVAGLGVASSLAKVTLERSREIALGRALGLDRLMNCKILALEGVMIGSAALVLGLVLGVILSLLLVFVINVQSFGWTIQYRFPLAFTLWASLGVITISALAGLVPARQIMNRNLAASLRYE